MAVVARWARRALSTITRGLEVKSWVFREGPRMPTARAEFGAVVQDGRWLVACGGSDADLFASQTADVLDLATERWVDEGTTTTTMMMRYERVGACCAAVEDRRALVFGGSTFASSSLLHTTEYLESLAFAALGGPKMLRPRADGAAAAVGGGRVVVVGGVVSSGGEATASTEVFDLATGTFSEGPTLTTARSACAAVAVDDDRVLVVGGRDAAGRALATTEVLDLATRTTTPGPALATARSSCACALLAGSSVVVLVLGGWSPDGRVLASTEALLFEMTSSGRRWPASSSFKPGPDMVHPRASFAAAVDANGSRLFALSGLRRHGDPPSDTVDILSFRGEVTQQAFFPPSSSS